MRISLLLAREPFGQILEDTLARFWSERYGGAHVVRWVAGPGGTGAPGKDGQVWLVNSYLNAIFTRRADPAVFEPIRLEFSRSTVWWRRPAQRAYTRLGLAPWSAPWLAHARLLVTPHVPGAAGLLIVPGNRKIRVLDRRAGLSYGIHKEGFRPDFMRREVAARREAVAWGVPVPELLEVSPQGRWFAERYVSGTPANRLAERGAALSAMRVIVEGLQCLQRATQGSESAGDHVAHLCRQIEELAADNSLIDAMTAAAVASLAQDLACQALSASVPSGLPVLTALTHGDLQPANVLVNETGAWLIDWEYAARRQMGYDALVYALAARSPGLAVRLARFVSQGLPAGLPFASWPGLAPEGREVRRRQAALFLLEELVLRLEENDEPTFTSLDSSLGELQVEAARWVEMIRGE